MTSSLRCRKDWLPVVLRDAVLTVGLITLAACVSVPRLGSRPQPFSKAPQASSLNGGEGQWPTMHWWDRYDDPQLDHLVAEALAGSPHLAQAKARVDEAAARAGVARSYRLPSVGLDGSVTRQKLSYNSIFPEQAVPKGWNDLGRASLGAQWQLDFWGKNRKAFEAAVSESRATDADLAAARLMLTTEVVREYIQLQLACERQDVAEEALRVRKESLQLVERRVDRGLDAPLAKEEAQARADSAEAALSAAKGRVAIERNALGALLGAGPDRGQSITRPSIPDQVLAEAPAYVSADLLGRKPEVVAARWRVEAAAKRVGVAKAAFYPDVNLAAFIGVEALGLNRLNDSGSEAGGIGPAIHLPIFEGGQLKSNYKASIAEYDGAVASYNEALIYALREAADALTELSTMKVQKAATSAAFEHSRTAYRMARSRYDGGLANYESVLIAEDTYLQDREADTEIRLYGLTLDVSLVNALGGGYQSTSSKTDSSHD